MFTPLTLPPGYFLSIEEGTVIVVRPTCNSSEAVLWGVDKCGGAGALPSIIIMPGAQLHAVGTMAWPHTSILFRST